MLPASENFAVSPVLMKARKGEIVLMRKTAFLGVAIFLWAGFASAQVPTSGNIFVGYSYENAGPAIAGLNFSRPNLNGWEASLEGRVLPHVGIVADFSGHYGSDKFVLFSPEGPLTVSASRHEEDVMFGPRVSLSIEKLRPFAELEVGVGHINTDGFGSDTSFAWAVGGGVDYRIFRPLAWRLQADYVGTRFFDSTQKDFRLSTGIVLRF
jgi:hypothetical protein